MNNCWIKRLSVLLICVVCFSSCGKKDNIKIGEDIGNSEINHVLLSKF